MHLAVSSQRLREAGYPTLMGSYLEWCPKIGTAVCGTACTVVWEVGKCENRRQMPFVISIYLLLDCLVTARSCPEGGQYFAVVRQYWLCGQV